MHITRHAVTIVTASDGTGTGYTDLCDGFVQAIRYVKTDYTDGVDVTVTCEQSAQAIVTLTDANASATVYPRGATATVANAAALYAAAGVAVLDKIPVANERVKIVIASGGDTKTGVFHVYVGG